MRSKNILSIVAFVAAFGLSAAFASLFIGENTRSHNSTNCFKYRQNTAVANAINELILEDSINGYNRAAKLYAIGESSQPDINSVTFAEHAEITGEYVAGSSILETNNLPNDFRAAWREHLQTWRDYSDFLNKSAEISSQSSCTLRKFQASEENYSREIDLTFEEVLQIGRSHGADVW